MLNSLLTLEEAVLLQAVSRFLPELPLFFIDGLEMFGFRKRFRGLDRCGKLVKLHLVPLAIRTMRVRPLGCSRSIADGPYSTRT